MKLNIVSNWKKSWKWISTWGLAFITYIAITGVPDPIINLFPNASKETVISIIALITFMGRFIDQTRKT